MKYLFSYLKTQSQVSLKRNKLTYIPWTITRNTCHSKDAIRKLRELTSAPIIKCHKVLKDCNGDIDMAYQKLYEMSFHTRIRTSDDCQGKIVIAITNPNSGMVGLLEVTTETDFVIQNEVFLSFIEKIRLSGSELLSMFTDTITDEFIVEFKNKLSASIYSEQRHIESKVRETINLGQLYLYNVNPSELKPNTVVGYYAHSSTNSCKHAGSIVGISILSYTDTNIENREKLDSLANEFAQHAVSQFGSTQPLESTLMFGGQLTGKEWLYQHQLTLVKSVVLSNQGSLKVSE